MSVKAITQNLTIHQGLLTVLGVLAILVAPAGSQYTASADEVKIDQGEPWITEKNLFFLSPHQDDIALTFGGLIMNHQGFPDSNSRYSVFFSMSNYTDNDLDLKTNQRVKAVTLMRAREDLDAVIDMFTSWQRVRYAAYGFYDAPLRDYVGPKTAGGGPGGDFSTFRKVEKEIYLDLVEELQLVLRQDDCAAFVLMANGSHIDHFILREAVIKAAHDLGETAKCQIFFGEDQPYTGDREHAKNVKTELRDLKQRLHLTTITYAVDRAQKIRLFKENYISQYDDSYITALEYRMEVVEGERVYEWERSDYANARTDPTCREDYCRLNPQQNER